MAHTNTNYKVSKVVLLMLNILISQQATLIFAIFKMYFTDTRWLLHQISNPHTERIGKNWTNMTKPMETVTEAQDWTASIKFSFSIKKSFVQPSSGQCCFSAHFHSNPKSAIVSRMTCQRSSLFTILPTFPVPLSYSYSCLISWS